MLIFAEVLRPRSHNIGTMKSNSEYVPLIVWYLIFCTELVMERCSFQCYATHARSSYSCCWFSAIKICADHICLLKRSCRKLEKRWRATKLESFRFAWIQSFKCYAQALCCQGWFNAPTWLNPIRTTIGFCLILWPSLLSPPLSLTCPTHLMICFSFIMIRSLKLERKL